MIQRKEHRYRTQDGETPSYKSFHEVHVTKDLGSTKIEELTAFIEKHIAEFKGHPADKHGIPLMFFERNKMPKFSLMSLSQDLKFKKNT
jgi:hypothetical protein